jgi:hypothetical protein
MDESESRTSNYFISFQPFLPTFRHDFLTIRIVFIVAFFLLLSRFSGTFFRRFTPVLGLESTEEIVS